MEVPGHCLPGLTKFHQIFYERSLLRSPQHHVGNDADRIKHLLLEQGSFLPPPPPPSLMTPGTGPEGLPG